MREVLTPFRRPGFRSPATSTAAYDVVLGLGSSDRRMTTGAFDLGR